MNVDRESQRRARAWLERVPDWPAKRGVFILLGPHGSGKTTVLREWAAAGGAEYVSANGALIERAFPGEPPEGLSELGRSVNDPFVAGELARAFQELAEAQTAPVVILDHWELLLDYDARLDPQGYLGDLAARTGRRFVLSAPGDERDGVLYVQKRDRYHWRASEGQFLGQWFALEPAR